MFRGVFRVECTMNQRAAHVGERGRTSKHFAAPFIECRTVIADAALLGSSLPLGMSKSGGKTRPGGLAE